MTEHSLRAIPAAADRWFETPIRKRALALNASAVILAHNHPSGVAEPSEADRNITLKLSKALGMVEIRMLDHLVVGGEHITSMAERGLI